MSVEPTLTYQLDSTTYEVLTEALGVMSREVVPPQGGESG